MSKIEYKKLYEIVQTVNAPVKLKTEEYQLTGNYPIIDQGKEFQAGFTDDENALLPLGEYILYGDHTLSVKYYNGRFAQGADGLKILKCKEGIEKFIYYALCTFNLHSNEYKRHWTQAKQISIPLPPLAIQQEIVSVLDSFTTLIDKMKKEVEMRKKQMEVYRKEIFVFKEGECEWKNLGRIGEVRMCKRILKYQTQEKGDVPFYKIGTFDKKADAYISKELYSEYKSKYYYPKIWDILISAAGTIGRCIEFDGSPSYYQDSNIVWIENDESLVLNSFLKKFYPIAKWKIDDGGVVKRLYNENLKSTQIPIPPLSVQQEIVRTLDAFETYISKLEKLIALRQKQYEYYREKLLTFE